MSSILHRGSSPGQSSHNRLCIIFCEPDTTTIIMSSFKAENSLIVFSNNIFALLCKITEKHHHHRSQHPHHQYIGILQVLLHLRTHDKAYFPSFCASALSALSALHCPTVSNCPPIGDELIKATQLNPKLSESGCIFREMETFCCKMHIGVQSSIMKTSRSKYNHKSASTLNASTM